MCAKGVGLGLFLSDSQESQSYDFDAIAHIRTIMWCRMTVKKFVRTVRPVFEKNEKKSKMAFLVIFVLFLAMFLRSQSYDFDAIAHAGAPLGVEKNVTIA